jgi:hypothetical protein
MCCEDFDTDCEPEYPCKIITDHCATCANSWDTTCESDSSDYHGDVGASDNSLHCMPCEPLGRQWYMRRCDNAVRFDKIHRDIRDADGNDFDNIERKSTANIQPYPQTLIDQYMTIDGTNDGFAVKDNRDTTHDNPIAECHETHLLDDGSDTIDIFLRAISVDNEQTVIPWIPGHKGGGGEQPERHCNNHVDVEADFGYMPNLGRIMQCKLPRMCQSQREELNNNHDIACVVEASACHTDRSSFADSAAPGMLEFILGALDAKDAAQPTTLIHDDDIACVAEASADHTVRSDSADSAAWGMLASTSGAMDAKDKAQPSTLTYNDERCRQVSKVLHYDRVIIEWCCGHDSMLGRPSARSDGCKVIRFTIDDDLRTMEGLQKALRIVQDCPRGRTLLWSSMPCAGGARGRH